MESPKLQVPQYSRGATSAGVSRGMMFVVVALLAVVIGLQSISLQRARSGDGQNGETVEGGRRNGRDAELEQALAIKLEDRNLPEAAVETWDRYLAVAEMSAVDEGKIRFRMGKLKQQAARYQDAVAEYYRAEKLLGDQAGDLSQKITVNVRACLEGLGQFADLTREMASRADESGTPETGGSLEDRQVVAQIGDEKITVADFDRMLTEMIERRIGMEAGLSAEEAQSARKEMHDQFNDPQARTQQLQQFVAARVLADQARKGGLHELAAFRAQMSDLADQLLATRLMLDEIPKRATVTAEDVERYYEANKAEYADAAKISIAHVLCDSEEKANEVLEKARGGAFFGALAVEHSLDGGTKENGGVIGQPMADSGEFVPGIGKNPELHVAVLVAAKDAVLPKSYASDRGWHVVKVVDRVERVQKTLEEVRERVAADARAARQKEVTQQYIEELLRGAEVTFYPDAFAGQGTVEGAANGDGV